MQNELIQPFIQETGLDEATALRLIGQFLRALPGDLIELQQAIDRSDFKSAGDLAHALKGASANLRLTALSGRVTELLMACRQSERSAALALSKDLADQADQTIAEFSQVS